jgi:hypothetical protein
MSSLRNRGLSHSGKPRFRLSLCHRQLQDRGALARRVSRTTFPEGSSSASWWTYSLSSFTRRNRATCEPNRRLNNSDSHSISRSNASSVPGLMHTAKPGSPTAQKPFVYIPPNFVVTSWSPTLAGREAKCPRLKSHIAKPPGGPGETDMMGRIGQRVQCQRSPCRHVPDGRRQWVRSAEHRNAGGRPPKRLPRTKRVEPSVRLSAAAGFTLTSGFPLG